MGSGSVGELRKSVLGTTWDVSVIHSIRYRTYLLGTTRAACCAYAQRLLPSLQRLVFLLHQLARMACWPTDLVERRELCHRLALADLKISSPSFQRLTHLVALRFGRHEFIVGRLTISERRGSYEASWLARSPPLAGVTWLCRSSVLRLLDHCP